MPIDKPLKWHDRLHDILTIVAIRWKKSKDLKTLGNLGSRMRCLPIDNKFSNCDQHPALACHYRMNVG